MLVGAPTHGAGTVYAFVRSGTSWVEQQKITASDGAPGDAFGSAISMAGGVALIGAPLADLPGKADAGAAYLFIRSNGSWQERSKLAAADAQVSASFGASTAVDQPAVVDASVRFGLGVGAPAFEVASLGKTGAAYQYWVSLAVDGEKCATADECFSGICPTAACCYQRCGACAPLPAGTEVSSGPTTCFGAMACDGKGGCGKKGGQPCSADGDCASGSCAAALCCSAPCSGPCRSCATGSCVPLPSGTEVTTGELTCSGSLVCNGRGGCRKKDGQACGDDADCAGEHCLAGICASSPATAPDGGPGHASDAASSPAPAAGCSCQVGGEAHAAAGVLLLSLALIASGFARRRNGRR